MKLKSKASKNPREEVGRKFSGEYFQVHSRLKDSTKDRCWYGITRYKTLSEAREALRKLTGKSDRVQVVAGIAVDFGEDTSSEYDYRIVRYQYEGEVLAIA